MSVDTRVNRPTPGLEASSSKRTAGQTTSRLSLEASSTSFFECQNNHLQLKQKKETPSTRPIIPASKIERLSYYRAYVSSPNRKQILVMQHVRFNIFLWYYVLDVFLKSLPHTYVHIFLASYTPEEHIFLPKMVPISYGLKYTLIFTSYVELLTYIDTTVIMMYYTMTSILYKNPWNRCEENTFIDLQFNYTVNCYNKEEFAKKFVNDTPLFHISAYVTPENELFQLAQLAWHRKYRQQFKRDIVFFFFIMVAAAIFHKKVLSKTFWKILHKFQWIVNFLDLVCLMYLTIVYFKKLDHKEEVNVPIFHISETLWKADMDTLVESTITPPVVHILTARSTQPIRPSSDCAMIIVSNALCYIFRGLLISNVKGHIESMLRAPLYHTESNRYSWFYFYTIFFSSFYLGDLYIMGFFSVYLVTELMVLLVTYHCLIETVTYEWKRIKSWYVTSIMTILGLLMYWFTNYMTRYILFVYGKAFSTLCEICFLYVLYPLGRLVDDYTFHYGVRPTQLRILTFRIVPLFSSLKFYRLMSCFLEVMMTSIYPKFPSNFKWTWSIAVAPVVLGFLVVIYRYVLIDRKDWKFMFRPLPSWGPRAFQVRQLRKQFDSRDFIGSQYPRLLSRYLLKRGEAESYKLELRYDTGRRSTPFQEIRFTDEKKQT